MYKKIPSCVNSALAIGKCSEPSTSIFKKKSQSLDQLFFSAGQNNFENKIKTYVSDKELLSQSMSSNHRKISHIYMVVQLSTWLVWWVFYWTFSLLVELQRGHDCVFLCPQLGQNFFDVTFQFLYLLIHVPYSKIKSKL